MIRLKTNIVHPEYFGRKLKSQSIETLLGNNGQVWMSNCPQERVYMGSAVRWVQYGDRILTAGLGLGMFVEMALVRGAQHITVIEKDSNVIEAVGPRFKKNLSVTVLCGDIKEYVRQTQNRYDFTYIDIWASDEDLELLERYEIKSLASKITRRQVICWSLYRSERKLKNDLFGILPDIDKIGQKIFSERCFEGGYLLFGLFLLPVFERDVNKFIRYISKYPCHARRQALLQFGYYNISRIKISLPNILG